jgi:sortase B
MRKRRRIKRNIMRIILLIILLICIICFIVSGYNILTWYLDGRSADKLINEATDMAEILETVEEGEAINPPDEEDNTEEQISDYWYYMSYPFINVNFTELKEKNSDTVGWIEVKGTNINYPIVQTTNNEYYLKHSFDKSYNIAGWIFLDYRSSFENMGKNTIVYGHGMLNQIMFGSLPNVLKNNWLQNNENHIIRISTPTENSLWQVISVYTIPPEGYYISTDFENDDAYQSFIETILSRSIYDFNTTVTINDQILTLSSCYSKSDRVVVHAKLIKKSVR